MQCTLLVLYANARRLYAPDTRVAVRQLARRGCRPVVLKAPECLPLNVRFAGRSGGRGPTIANRHCTRAKHNFVMPRWSAVGSGWTPEHVPSLKLYAAFQVASILQSCLRAYVAFLLHAGSVDDTGLADHVHVGSVTAMPCGNASFGSAHAWRISHRRTA